MNSAPPTTAKRANTEQSGAPRELAIAQLESVQGGVLWRKPNGTWDGGNWWDAPRGTQFQLL